MKVSIIGAGNVGATLAKRVAESNLADVVLLDIVGDLAKGKSLDLLHAAQVVRYTKSVQGTDDYKDIKEDDQRVNYVLKHGLQKTTSKYLESRVQFIILLKKYKLDTPSFMHMIEKLDTYIPNLFQDSIQQQTLTN